MSDIFSDFAIAIIIYFVFWSYVIYMLISDWSKRPERLRRSFFYKMTWGGGLPGMMMFQAFLISATHAEENFLYIKALPIFLFVFLIRLTLNFKISMAAYFEMKYTEAYEQQRLYYRTLLFLTVFITIIFAVIVAGTAIQGTEDTLTDSQRKTNELIERIRQPE